MAKNLVRFIDGDEVAFTEPIRNVGSNRKRNRDRIARQKERREARLMSLKNRPAVGYQHNKVARKRARMFKEVL